jgi:hypothetical protein
MLTVHSFAHLKSGCRAAITVKENRLLEHNSVLQDIQTLRAHVCVMFELPPKVSVSH